MYVYTCNGILERKVEGAIRDGAATPRAVHAVCGARPNAAGASLKSPTASARRVCANRLRN